ncbi:MAG: hypothetical protein K2O59_01650 [Lachnospiraceae bacterium]|nr:hypothetical protein [Lachnospiraceae bacterium]MDE7176495.1 hypothetical protein [Lachnospiraceae bacterium]
MGWEYIHATKYTSKGAVDKKAEIDEHYNWQDEKKKVQVIKSCMVGATYYGAIQVTYFDTGKREVCASVVLTHTDSQSYYNLGMKFMTECSGPYAVNCPASILKLLTPTEDEYAIEWRKQCYAAIERKKSPRALKNLPIGAVIRYTNRNGEVIELLKHRPGYQFKRPFWYCAASGRYMPANRIPDDYEIVSA